MLQRFPTLACALGIGLATAAAAAAPADPGLVWRGDLATSRTAMTGLAEAWRKAGNPALRLEPFSTIAGIDAALAGEADLAGSAREPCARRSEEAGLVFTPIAWDALVLVVHRDNPVHDISLGQLHDVYRGKLGNWSALGGTAEKINLYAVASPLDGIEYSLRKYLFRRGNQPVAAGRLYINTRQLEDAVALDPASLGVSTLSGIRDNPRLRALAIDGVSPTLEHLEDGSYPLAQPLYLVSTGEAPRQELVDAFLHFATSEAGRDALLAGQLLPYDGTAALALDSERHLVDVQDRSSPRRDGPVAAPGATLAARTAVAPTSERTLEARAQLAAQREREAAGSRARERNEGRAEAEAGSTDPDGGEDAGSGT